ncbi:MAG: putative oxidoreductase [Caulobacteraceae bacterium]|jgi:NAD(P)-dependent dehydrogenase (short-subunit alcohol dehydrogenase family)|nr:putative oxidoreductase [Caulobacteraceae bacterium]
MAILDKFRLDGHAAVVTGAGRGIGRAIALGLAEAGADVVVSARRTHEIEAVAQEVRDRGRKGVAITADMLDMKQIDHLAAEAERALGKLTIWVSNAGGADDRVARNLVDVPEYQWDFQDGLNLKAVWAGGVAAAKRMGEGASIVNISSIAAFKPSPGNGPYAVAKAGVNSLTRTMAVELAPKIRVNAVAPGPIPTEVFMEFLKLTEDMLPAFTKQIGVPMQRLGREEDIAGAVVYLCSPAASWVTGEIITVSGGM